MTLRAPKSYPTFIAYAIMLRSDSSSAPPRWFVLSLVALLIASLILRFWGLSRFNTLVFDEVYYANFARGYLNGVQEFGGHPPLSTYLIAGGIWLANHTPLGAEGLKNSATGMMLTPFSYRWMNALWGAFIPVIVGAIAYLLTYRATFGFIAGLFAAMDGLILVESRYALNNIYLVIFGLLGQLFLLLALRHVPTKSLKLPPLKAHLYLGLAGIFLGASVAIKWNGLWFLLGVYLIWGLGWVFRWLNHLRPGLLTAPMQTTLPKTPLAHLGYLHIGWVAIYLGIVPFVTYYLSWIPYMRLDPSTSFWGWQAKILDYHNRVGGMDAHPYCSPWYTWPLMWRPVAYFYKPAQAANDPVPIVGPPLPQGSERIVYDVHAIGNPILWWLSTAAIALLLVILVSQFKSWLPTNKKRPVHPIMTAYTWPALYLVCLWMTNWLPWLRVTRCTFLYHYMGASMFSLMAIALLVDRWLSNADPWQKIAGITTIVLVTAAFIFWMPLYLGLPIPIEAIQLRRWFVSWI